MPTALQSALDLLASKFSVGTLVKESDRVFQLPFKSPFDGEPLSLSYQDTVTRLVSGDLAIDWLTKDVRFADTNLPADFNPSSLNVVGGLPVTDLLAAGAAAVTTENKPAPPFPPGVPGTLGRLRGSVPIPITSLETLTQTDISIDLRVRIRDEAGKATTDVQWQFFQNPVMVLVPGATPDLEGQASELLVSVTPKVGLLRVALPVLFAELTALPNPVEKRFIEVSIRLTQGGASSGWIDLPAVELVLPVVPVPTVLVLFTNKDFGGVPLIVVPGDSILTDLGTTQSHLGDGS